MRINDQFRFAGRALAAVPLRTGLILLAMAIGAGAVILLTALGEGARHYVIGKFSSLGTNLLIVIPGRSETRGAAPPLLGETPRDLTLDDSLALLRSSTIKAVAPIVVGNAPVSFANREREVAVLGTTSAFLPVRRLHMARGRFLPAGEVHQARPICVLGATLATELFGATPPLGQWLRIGDRRFLVIGVLAPAGVSIGVDLDDIAVIPAASAQALFDTNSVFRILVEARDRYAIAAAQQAVTEIITQRHEGENDVTVITQDAVLATFDRILTTLTLAVAGIGAVSLLVAGILVMNVMLVAVRQRTAEIGLLRALGATPARVAGLFLVEAGLLSLAGALLGCGLGISGIHLVAASGVLEDFPLAPVPWSVAAAVGVALATGLGFGVLPARQAARLEVVAALTRR